MVKIELFQNIKNQSFLAFRKVRKYRSFPLTGLNVRRTAERVHQFIAFLLWMSTITGASAPICAPLTKPSADFSESSKSCSALLSTTRTTSAAANSKYVKCLFRVYSQKLKHFKCKKRVLQGRVREPFKMTF